MTPRSLHVVVWMFAALLVGAATSAACCLTAPLPIPGRPRLVGAPTKACAGCLPIIVDDSDAGPPWSGRDAGDVGLDAGPTGDADVG